MKNRIVAIVQARMGSSRLPGKTMADVGGKPVLEYVMERVKRIPGIDSAVVATTHEERDAPIVDWCNRFDIPVVMGSEDDVLERYVNAADASGADAIVRITADCPLLDPGVSGEVVRVFGETNCAYAANVIERTYPLGMDTEVVAVGALREAAEEAIERYDREHVTPFIRSKPKRFPQASVTAPPALHRPRYRLCVDTEEDLALVRAIVEQLGPGNTFGLADMIELLDNHPDLPAINAHIQQKSE